jgi:NAD(P)-dependent dehydrogenase (short-subunit alcohol dehydrogenase family)
MDLQLTNTTAVVTGASRGIGLATGGGEGEGQTGGFLSFIDQQWQHSLDLNFLAAVRTSRAALPSLLRRRGALVTSPPTPPGCRMPGPSPTPPRRPR